MPFQLEPEHSRLFGICELELYDINFEINESSKTAGTRNSWAVCHQAVPGGLETGERYTRAKLGEMEGLREKQFLTSGKSTPKLLGWLFYMEGVLLFFGRSPANQYHQLIGW